jgi:hypothetical protein
MTIMPPRNFPEFLLYDPIGTIMTIIVLILIIVAGIRFWLDWSTMQTNINLANICIGGACK